MSHPACGTLLLQPQQTKMLPYKVVMRVEGVSICKVLGQHLMCYRGYKSFLNGINTMEFLGIRLLLNGKIQIIKKTKLQR